MPDSKRITEVFPQPSPSSTSLGFKLLSLDMKKWETRVRFEGRQEFTNPAGVIQGGYLVAMMDDTIGMLTGMKAGKRALPSTVDLHTHFLRPVRVGVIEVVARLRNIGRAMVFAEAELFDSRGKEAARCAASLTLNPVVQKHDTHDE
ncbi:PaaI family thioesterase [Hyphomonas oceanitis]|uniref:Thioesterase family protein n=1 Tax=Hyphomonas oceanitis SCH89 TaxID=1280953 RepID=A0A059GBG2_9PROT|nr:PaaI family thioesterase [Hyphomonas oceanitis]KDA04074.1 thioesterase family protein [Hyphomonas oceanitis SCH89]